MYLQTAMGQWATPLLGMSMVTDYFFLKAFLRANFDLRRRTIERSNKRMKIENPGVGRPLLGLAKMHDSFDIFRT